MLGEYFRANRHCAGLGSSSTPSRPAAVGVCAMRSPLAARRRRVGGLDGVIPRVGGGAAAPRGGVAAQIADHLAHYCPCTSFFAEVVCDLGKTEWCVMSCSHANPLLRA